jgi:uncharacterized delta-60 repeat protein
MKRVFARALFIITLNLQAGSPASLDPSFTPVILTQSARFAIRDDGTILLLDEGPFPQKVSRWGGLPSPFSTGILARGGEGACEYGDLYLQSDGRILVTGEAIRLATGKVGGLVRLNTDGTADASFEPFGLTRCGQQQITFDEQGRMFLDPNVRLLPDGSRDSSFKLDENRLNELGVGVGVVGTITALPNGNLLAAVLAHEQRDLLLIRLRPSGDLDETFAPELLRTLSGPEAFWAPWPFFLKANGQVLLAASEITTTESAEAHVWRFTTEGLLDTTFPSSVVSNGIIRTMAQQKDGKLILGGGFTEVDGVTRHGLARLNQNGTLDASFDPAIWFNLAGSQDVLRVALQPDGRIIVLTRFLGESTILTRLYGDQLPFFLTDETVYYKSRDGDMNLVFTASENQNFAVEASSSLSSPDWREIPYRRWGANENRIGVADTNALYFPRRFYRIVVK